MSMTGDVSMSKHVLGLRSVTTTPQRSNNSLSFFKSKSRSVVPVAVPVGMIASLTESCIIRVWVTDAGTKQDVGIHRYMRIQTMTDLGV